MYTTRTLITADPPTVTVGAGAVEEVDYPSADYREKGKFRASRASLQSPLPRWVPVGLDAPAQAASTRQLRRVPATAPRRPRIPALQPPLALGAVGGLAFSPCAFPPGPRERTERLYGTASGGPRVLSRLAVLNSLPRVNPPRQLS